MIKLPIILSEHISWQQAITSAIQTRQRLEEIAVKDKDYIRPIILFQAENKDKEITIEILAKYLIENEGINSKQIAIVTSDQKELDNIDLYNPNCNIRYVITVQALKEGWDCSFAYVLCSVANTKSSTSVEQLLGRVLRMPYAKERTQSDLNQAYAHVSSKSWPYAVSELHDRLVNMGFEQQEAEDYIYAQQSFLAEEVKLSSFSVNLSKDPNLSTLDLTERTLIAVTKVSEEIFELKVKQGFNNVLIEKLIASVKDKEEKREIAIKSKIYFKYQEGKLAPAQRGELFIVPQLCLNFGDSIELAEPELYLDRNGWNLLDYPTVLTQYEFAIDDQAKQYSIDIVGQKIMIKFLNKLEQLNFKEIKTELTIVDFCCWLDKKLRAQDIKQEVLLEFLLRTIKNLLARDDLDLPKLLLGKYTLMKVLREKIIDYRKQAYSEGYQCCMFGKEAIVTVHPQNFSFCFDRDNYPANILYDGKLGFNKHYYPRIAVMNKEEADCAFIIDQNSNVKYWVRNLERDSKHAFWLPTSTDKFYPDFIAMLKNGKLLVVEYKGKHLKNADTEEKELIGKMWAEKSGHLFLLAWKKDDANRDLYFYKLRKR